MMSSCFAVADMGTNSFHMIIAKPAGNGKLKIIDKERKVIRLGFHKGEELSFISDEETALALETLCKFKKLADSYNASFRAVATSAVREAKNRYEFIKKIKDESGITVEILDGKNEARLIYSGAEKVLFLKGEDTLCIDIGGGSTEFINVRNNKTIFAESIKVGAVRLSKHFFPDFVITDERLNDCAAYIKKIFKSYLSEYSKNKFDIVVGTSGTIESIASIIIKQRNIKIPKSLNGVSFNKTKLKAVTETILAANTMENRMTIKGMEAKRADIIPAGLLILNEAFDFFNIDHITISDYALREGVIFEMIENKKSD